MGGHVMMMKMIMVVMMKQEKTLPLVGMEPESFFPFIVEPGSLAF